MRNQLSTILAVSALLVLVAPSAATSDSSPEFRSLNGGGNNVAHPNWGKAGALHARVAAPTYADGIGATQGGPSARYVSNRIFNDIGQNVFSETGASQIAWLWGQFIDHTPNCRMLPMRRPGELRRSDRRSNDRTCPDNRLLAAV